MTVEASKTEKQRGKWLKKKEQNIQELWENYKRCDKHTIGLPEREEAEKGTGTIFEGIMTENFPKLMSDTKS